MAENKSISKTMRQNIEVAVGTSEIMELNPRLGKDSDVFPYAYHEVASDIVKDPELVNWDEVVLLDFKDRDAEMTFPETRTVTADENDYKIVLEHFSKRPNVHRVQFAYLTRLVLLYTRKKLRDSKGIIEIQNTSEEGIDNIDGVELLRRINDKAAELIKKGELSKIYEFLEV